MNALETLKQAINKAAHDQYDEALELARGIQGECSNDLILEEVRIVWLYCSLKIGAVSTRKEAVERILSRRSDLSDLTYSIRAFLALFIGDFVKACDEIGRQDTQEYGANEWSRYGASLLGCGKMVEAVRAFEMAVMKEPDVSVHHSNVAGGYWRLGDASQALACYREAIRLDRNNIKALEAAVAAAYACNAEDDVIGDLELILDAEENHLVAIRMLTRLLLGQKRYRECNALYNSRLRTIETINKIDADCSREKEKNFQIGLRKAVIEVYIRQDQKIQAVSTLKELLELMPNDAGVKTSLAHLYIEQDRLGDAESLLEEIGECRVPHGSLGLMQVEICLRKDKTEEAVDLLDKLIEEGECRVEAIERKAAVLIQNGKIDEASTLLRSIISERPLVALALAQSTDYSFDTETLEMFDGLLRNPILDLEIREGVLFGLATYFDRAKEVDKSFAYLAAANASVRRRLQYSASDFSYRVKKTISIFSKPISRNAASYSLRPVFIVGMPRSGTTLTESILGSHSKIYACGELSYLPRIAHLFERDHKTLLSQLTDSTASDNILAKLGAMYLEKISVPESVGMFTDKLPHNFLNLGLVKLLFPESIVIHVRRDPRAVCLSNFQQNFVARNGLLGYSFDLRDMAEHVNDYYRIMEHWRNIGIPMFEFWYEDLVTDPAHVAKQLLDFCGQEWEDGVLAFESLKRAVKTASVTQVRKKMYNSSIDRWRRYETYLDEFTSNLDFECVELYGAGMS